MFGLNAITFIRRQWELNARTDPYWAILTRPDRRNRRWQKDEFFATGREIVQHHLRLLDQKGVAYTRGRVLDFGCGVGRLSQALAREFDQVVGLDVSDQMLMLARANLAGQANVHYVKNLRPDLGMFRNGEFDFVYTLITLQHMPPALARAYLAEFVRVLRPDGVAFFQIIVDRKKASLFWPPTLFKQAWRALNRVLVFQLGMEMHVVPVRDIEATLAAAGGQIVASWAEEMGGNNFHSLIFVVRPRTASQK